jgi:hypothetical protein
MTEWSDEQLLAAADNPGLAPTEDRRLSELLDRQQAGALTAGKRSEFMGLMEKYQTQLLRKARALCESIRRGLRPPLQP